MKTDKERDNSNFDSYERIKAKYEKQFQINQELLAACKRAARVLEYKDVQTMAILNNAIANAEARP